VKKTKFKVARILTKLHCTCGLSFWPDLELDSIPKALSWLQGPGVRHLDHQCWEKTKRDITSRVRDKLEWGRAERRKSGRVTSFLSDRGIRLKKTRHEVAPGTPCSEDTLIQNVAILEKSYDL